MVANEEARDAAVGALDPVDGGQANMLGRHADFDDEWEEMPIERMSAVELEDDSDESDTPNVPSHVRSQRAHAARRMHLGSRGTLAHATSNHAGEHLDVHDVRGYDWRTRPDADESVEEPRGTEYTQLRLDEAEDEEELHAATEYLFQEDMNRIGDMDDDPTAAPISQLAMTKRLLNETQKIAYVGLCCITAYEMLRETQHLEPTEPKPASKNTSEWLLRVMVRLYQHLDIDVQEQTMIDSLAHHGILASDLARSLITTHTIANPGYDPTLDDSTDEPPKPVLPTPSTESGPPAEPAVTAAAADDSAAAATVLPSSPPLAPAPVHGDVKTPVRTDPNTAAQIAERDAAATESTASAPVVDAQALHRPEPSVPPSQNTLEGVTTEISASSKTITLDIRWTVLCDLFLVLTADSVYDARSRVLLERVAQALQLTWMDLTKFEKRVTDALEIEEDVQTLNDARISERRRASAQKKRMMMMGLATVGGGLVIGLSAGLLAPVIGAGIGAALGAVGISGTSAFLGGGVGAAAITTTGTLGGAALGGRGMSRRTRSVKTFEFRPMHNHKRVNCIVTVPGFLRGPEDDPTLPFGVIDPVMGDAFSVMWEPEMMREMGNAMSILWNETIVQGVQQVLAATVAGAMFSALAWPLWLTKLSYIIDNPWSNATERARAAGLILADVLMNRQLGVRPITLVGFSLGARMIYYALRELAHKKAYGIVQNVYLLGAPVTAREAEWKQVRSVVSGRFVNAFSRSDWLLAYLHRATSGGFHSIAGLHPIEYDCNIENVDVTHLVPGHLSYRVLTPLVLGELGFKTTADYFDEPESLDQVPEREVVFDAGLDTPSTPKSKLSFKNIFSRKTPREDRTERTAAALSAAVRTTAADAGARDEYVVDDDAPETEDDQKSAGVTGPPAATEQASEPMPGSKEGATEVSVDTKEPTQTVGSDATAGAVEQAEAPAQHSVDNLAASASATDLDAPSQVPVPTEREEASSARPGQEEVPVSKKPASPSAALDSPARAASAAAASAEALTEPHQNVRAEPTAARDAEPATMSHDATERSEAPSPSPPTVPVSPPDTDEPTDAPPAPAPPAAAFASVAATAGNYGLSSEEAERLASQFQSTTLSAAPTFSADDAWDSPSLAIPLSDSADASNDPRRAADRARLPEWAAENPWG